MGGGSDEPPPILRGALESGPLLGRRCRLAVAAETGLSTARKDGYRLDIGKQRRLRCSHVWCAPSGLERVRRQFKRGEEVECCVDKGSAWSSFASQGS